MWSYNVNLALRFLQLTKKMCVTKLGTPITKMRKRQFSMNKWKNAKVKGRPKKMPYNWSFRNICDSIQNSHDRSRVPGCTPSATGVILRQDATSWKSAPIVRGEVP